MSNGFKHIIEPQNENFALRVLWLDDFPQNAHIQSVPTKRELSRYFDIRHCGTLTQMKYLIRSGKWQPDVILADWNMESAHSQETDPANKAASLNPIVGFSAAVDEAKELHKCRHFCRVISCSASHEKPLSDMLISDPKHGPLLASVDTSGYPGLLDSNSFGVRQDSDDSRRLMGIVAKSFREGLLAAADAGTLHGTEYSNWFRLSGKIDEAQDLSAIQDILHKEPGLSVRDDLENRVLPLGAIFADVIFAEEVNDLTESKATIQVFCKTINQGKWHALVLQNEQNVREIFARLFNKWPVRLLRDAEFTEPQDVILLGRIAPGKLDGAILKTELSAYKRDRDAATCILGMLCVLEAAQRIYLQNLSKIEIAKMCLREIEVAEERSGVEIDAVVVDIQKFLYSEAASEKNDILDGCMAKWERRVNDNDIVRFAWPITGGAASSWNMATGATKHLTNSTHWSSSIPQEFERNFPDVKQFRCAIDRFVTQVGTEQRVEPESINQLLHEFLIVS